MDAEYVLFRYVIHSMAVAMPHCWIIEASVWETNYIFYVQWRYFEISYTHWCNKVNSEENSRK